MPKPKDLFLTQLPEGKLHSAFRALRDSPSHGAARSLMNSLYERMGNRQRAFISSFQSDGFHSHLFELGCYAYLEEARFQIQRPIPSPDFLVTAPSGYKLAIEATTANPPTGRLTDISLRKLAELTQDEIARKVECEFPDRIHAILRRKLMHKYHENPQCRGVPLVLVVAPFFEPGSTTYVDISLLDLFYGRAENDRGTIGFFHDLQAAQISGVLYTNAFTVPRFLRLATNWENADIVAEREGICYREDDPESTYGFRYRMGAPETPKERWAEGVTLFLNPNAANPISESALPCSCAFSFDDGDIIRSIYGFHPVASSTFMYPRSTTSVYATAHN